MNILKILEILDTYPLDIQVVILYLIAKYYLPNSNEDTKQIVGKWLFQQYNLFDKVYNNLYVVDEYSLHIFIDTLHKLILQVGIPYHLSEKLFQIRKFFHRRLKYDLDSILNIKSYESLVNKSIVEKLVDDLLEEFNNYLKYRLVYHYNQLVFFDHVGNRVQKIGKYYVILDNNNVLGNSICSIRVFRYFGQIGFLVLINNEKPFIILDDNRKIEEFEFADVDTIKIDNQVFKLHYLQVDEKGSFYLQDLEVKEFPDEIERYLTTAFVKDKLANKYYHVDEIWFDRKKLKEILIKLITTYKYSDYVHHGIWNHLVCNKASDFANEIVKPFLAKRLNLLILQVNKDPSVNNMQKITSNKPEYALAIINSLCKIPERNTIFIAWKDKPEDVNADVVNKSILRRFPTISYYTLTSID